ncbi:MAG TPA: polymer-forming cytoskeletal protein [Candidatus Bathyarchaeia archaeon]
MKNLTSWNRFVVIFCLFLTITLIFPTSALAQGLYAESTVGNGVVVDQNLILFGPQVEMDGVINGDLLAVGTDVKINGEVNGSLVIIGRTVTLNGPVSGSAYISSLYLILGPQASIVRDLSYIGGRLETQTGSSINRDLNAISLEATLSGKVGREMHALIGPLNLFQAVYNFMLEKGWISTPLRFNLPSFNRGSDLQPYARMAFSLPAIKNIFSISNASANKQALQAGSGLQAAQQATTFNINGLRNWGVPLLRNLAALLILGLLALWLFPAQLSLAGEQVQLKPWRALLSGILVFILGWLLALLAFALIVALALFLYWLSLPTLGFFIGAMGLMGLGLLISVFWLCIVYFSKIIIAYLLSTLFFKRFIPKYAHIKILPFLVGVIIYALLASIPYLGWLIAVITTLFGLGALWMLTSPRKMPVGTSTVEPQPVDTEPTAEPQPVGTEPASDNATDK